MELYNISRFQFINKFLKIKYIKQVKTMIMKLNDEKLKAFFYSVYIKFSCIDLCKNFEEYFTTKRKDLFKVIKSFILDLYPSHLPTKLELIVKESVFSIISLLGKCLFLPTVTELSNFVDKLISNDQNMIRYFSKFFFLGPSSFYLINPSIYNQLKKLHVNLSELFQSNISNLFIFSKDANEFKIPYIDALFDHLQYILLNEPNSISIAMRIIIYLLYYDFSDLNFSIELEKRLISFCKILYNKIIEISEVRENDDKFASLDLTMISNEKYEEKQFLELDHSSYIGGGQTMKFL